MMGVKKNRQSLAAFTRDLSDLMAKLQLVAKSAQRDIVREATRKGGEVVLRSAKRRLHRAPHAYAATLADGTTITRQPGELADAMMMVRLPAAELPAKHTAYKVGFLRNPSVHHGIGHIAAFVEYGVSPHKITTRHVATGATVELNHPGHAAYPFLRPAVLASQNKVYQTMRDVISRRLYQEWQKNHVKS